MVELRVSTMKLYTSKFRGQSLTVEALSLNDETLSLTVEAQSLNEGVPHLKISSSEPQ